VEHAPQTWSVLRAKILFTLFFSWRRERLQRP